MKVRKCVSAATALLGLMIAVPVSAQQRSLTLSDVHLCCPMCAKAIHGAIKKVELVSAEVNSDKKTVTLSGEEGVTREHAIKALKAVATAGFYGKSDREQFKMKDESKGMSGKVASLELSGIHNCCGACDKAIKSVVAGVDGTDPLEIKKNARNFKVTGEFDGAALVKAFNKAGFYVKVKKDDK